LSFDAIAEDVEVARQRAVALIERHANAISRSNVILITTEPQPT
jgi:hypothetical protein